MNEPLMDLVVNLYNDIMNHFSYLEFVERTFEEEIDLLKKNDRYKVFMEFQKIGWLTHSLEEWKNNQELDFPLLVKDVDSGETKKEKSDELKEKYLKNSVTFLEEFHQNNIERKGVSFDDYIVDFVENEEGIVAYLKFKNTLVRDSFLEYESSITGFTHKVEVFKKTSIVNVCNTFENYISELLYLIYKTYPGILGKVQKNFAISRVLEASNLEEIKEELLDEHIKTAMYGDVDKWINNLSEINKKIGEEIDSHNIDLVKYIYLVRNLVVHNGSIVNSLFIDKTEKIDAKELGVTETFEKDKIIDFDKLNIRKMSEFVFLLGYKLGYLFYNDKQEKEALKGKQSFFENEIGLELYRKGLYELTEQIYKFLWKYRSKIDREDEMLLAINYAMTTKKLKGDFEAILSQVDFSGCSNDYNLSLCALRDDSEGVIREFSFLLSQKESTYYEILNWPILKDIVNGKEFIEYARLNFPEEELIYYNFKEESGIMNLVEEEETYEVEEND